jgi:peroxiredoxin
VTGSGFQCLPHNKHVAEGELPFAASCLYSSAVVSRCSASFVLLAALWLIPSCALGRGLEHTEVSLESNTLILTRLGWRVDQTTIQPSDIPLRRGDLIINIASEPAASLGPLSLINLFDEALRKCVPATLRRDGKVIKVRLRNRPCEQPYDGFHSAKNGLTAPAFALPDMDGHFVSPSAYPGRWVLLAFGSVSCPPCVAEIPDLNRLEERFRGSLVVLMLDINDNVQQVRSLVRNRGVRYPVIPVGDINGQIPTEYGVSSPDGAVTIPVDVLIRPNRYISYVQVGGSGTMAFDAVTSQLKDR